MKTNFIPQLKLSKLTLLAVGAILAGIPLLSAMPAKAAVNAGFSLSPATKTLTVGDELVVNLVLETGGNSVLAWKAAINYSTADFNAVSVVADPSSHFTLNPATDVASGGTIKLARYATSASTTGGTVAKITLHSTAIGSKTLSFAHICSSTFDASQCSGVTDSSGANLLATVNNGNYTVSPVPVAGSPGSTTPKKKAKSVINKVADAVAAVVSPSTDAEQITTKAARGTVKLVVTNQKSKAVVGAKVTLAGVSGLTDKNGQVVLAKLYPGEANGTISYKGKTQNITVDVLSGTSVDSPQLVNVTFKTSGGGLLFPILFTVIGIAVIIGLIDLVFVSKGGFKPEKALQDRDKFDSSSPGNVIKPSSS